jgi:F-type H+-transporting ATPase subunit a
MASVGVFKHLGKFFNFSNPINFFIGILELISELAKIISLSFRLFGNVFAGEVLLTIIFSLAPYIVPLPFMGLELFVGLIQAFIFAMITLVSISLHTAIHGEEEHAATAH